MENCENYILGKPKVSVIVPAYNLEVYIEACLSSLLNQTLKDIEIIVVNDGSTDTTQEKIEKFAQKDKRIIPILLENGGVGNARNHGISISKGEYIGFVDGDDYVDNDYFEKLYLTAIKHNADISVANILKHKKSIRYHLVHKKEKIATRIKDKIKLCQDKKGRFFYIWHRLYKSEFIKNIKFDTDVYYEDVMFSARSIYAANKIVTVSDTNYHYIYRKTSIVKSKANRDKKNNDAVMVREQLQKFAHDKGFELPEDANYSIKNWILRPLLKWHKGLYKRKTHRKSVG